MMQSLIWPPGRVSSLIGRNCLLIPVASRDQNQTRVHPRRLGSKHNMLSSLHTSYCMHKTKLCDPHELHSHWPRSLKKLTKETNIDTCRCKLTKTKSPWVDRIFPSPLDSSQKSLIRLYDPISCQLPFSCSLIEWSKLISRRNLILTMKGQRKIGKTRINRIRMKQ